MSIEAAILLSTITGIVCALLGAVVGNSVAMMAFRDARGKRG